jgi:hypothetical protein
LDEEKEILKRAIKEYFDVMIKNHFLLKKETQVFFINYEEEALMKNLVPVNKAKSPQKKHSRSNSNPLV